MSSSDGAPSGAAIRDLVIVRDRRRSSPFSREELERLVRAGRVRDGDGLRMLRDGKWKDVGTVGDQQWFREVASLDSPDQRPGAAPAVPSLGMRFALWRTCTALALAGLVDVLNLLFALIPPVYIAIDVVAAAAIWFVLGRPRLLMGVLLLEAVPGVGVVPLWTLVVGLIIVTGSIPARGLEDLGSRGPVWKAAATLASKFQRDGEKAPGAKTGK